jgi:hypothetical protein
VRVVIDENRKKSRRKYRRMGIGKAEVENSTEKMMT